MPDYQLPTHAVGQPVASNLTPFLAITLVMLVWGVASEAREIITGFLNEVRFE